MKPFVADVHMHSILSGHAFGTIRELAAEASRRGLSLIGVTEHAPGIPGTVDPIYFRNLCDAPRELYDVEMLYGSEVNVLNGGELSLDQRHLNYLDYAIAGIHGLCYEDAGAVKNTDNVIRCMENPKVKIISHPDTDQYPMDYPALVEGAKEFDVALELNNSSLRKPKSRAFSSWWIRTPTTPARWATSIWRGSCWKQWTLTRTCFSITICRSSRSSFWMGKMCKATDLSVVFAVFW